jgi:archaellum component FlaD/FlaE
MANFLERIAALEAFMQRVEEAPADEEKQNDTEARISALEDKYEDHESRLAALESGEEEESEEEEREQESEEEEEEPAAEKKEDEQEARVQKAVADGVRQALAALGLDAPAPTVSTPGVTSGHKSLIDQYSAIKDPTERAAFMRAHEKEITAAIRKLR